MKVRVPMKQVRAMAHTTKAQDVKKRSEKMQKEI